MEPKLPRTSVALLRGALVGAAGGTVFGVFSGLAYFARNHDVKLPWWSLAAAYLPYAVVSGALVAGFAAGAVAMLDRFVGGRTWAAPLPSAMIGGALGCLLPGAVGGGCFASMHAPFMGGIGMFAIPVVASVLVGIALAGHDRMLSGRSARVGLVSIVAIGLALALGAAIAAGVLSITDERMLDRLRDLVAFFTPGPVDPEHAAWEGGLTGLVVVGSLCGVALGGGLGAYVGGVMSIARKLA